MEPEVISPDLVDQNSVTEIEKNEVATTPIKKLTKSQRSALGGAAKAANARARAKAKESKPEKIKVAKVKPDGVSNPNNPLHKGSTRMRLFKALKKYTDGLTASEIKARTGMLPNSGHLAVLLGEEVEAKRIKKASVSDANEKNYTIYLLTPKGLKDLEDEKIDGNKNAGNRIGQAWTKARIDFGKEEKKLNYNPKAKAKAKKKAKKEAASAAE